MRNRRLRTILVGTAVLLACLPTEPCACPPALARAIVFGQVQDAAGVPSPDHVVAVLLSHRSFETTCDFMSPLEFGIPGEQVTDAAGRFRADVFSPADGVHCVRVIAFTGSRGVSDSVLVDLLVPLQYEPARPDSVGTVLRLPE